MKAAIIHAAHDLRIEDAAAQPVGPRDVAVRVRAGGICGSDLHYFNHGGFGAIRLREPMILGHEVAGEVAGIGADVGTVAVGDRVAVNPSLPCGHCRFCLAGQPNHCADMRFFGSAMRMPHVQGGFRETLVCTEAQAIRVPPGLDLNHAAFAEPLAVCLHAARQAGELLGQRVLVTGAGPIGALMVLVARHAGAAEVVATDVVDAPLALLAQIGADRVVNVRERPDALHEYGADKGRFDVMFECSGNPAALSGALALVRPRGVVAQVGLGGAEATIPLNLIVAKEIALRGSFRFHEEFAWAVRCIANGAIDVAPLLTEIVPLAEAERAFALAGDRTRAMKVQLAL